MLLTIDNLSKKYPGKKGVRANIDVSIKVDHGQIVGLLGHNGAGKTTLANQVVGLLKPDNGKILLENKDLIANPYLARELISIQPQSNMPIGALTPIQAIETVGRIRGGEKAYIRKRTQELIEELELGAWAKKPCYTNSGGVVRLTSFCMVSVNPGKLLILDEPTNDVDPERRHLLWKSIRNIAAQGTGILVITHNVNEIERIADYFYILNEGRVLTHGTPQEISRKDNNTFYLRIDVNTRTNGIFHLPENFIVHDSSPQHQIFVIKENQVEDAVQWAHQLKKEDKILSFDLSGTRLEQTYLALTRNGGKHHEN